MPNRRMRQTPARRTRQLPDITQNNEQDLLTGLSVDEIPPNNHYLNSYPSLLSFFQQTPIDRHAFVQGVHMVYGWMPKISNVSYENIEQVVPILQQAKNGELLGQADLEFLFETVNNFSIPGTSKLLHFANPNRYPIIDSKIYTYICSRIPTLSILPLSELKYGEAAQFYLMCQAGFSRLVTSETGIEIVDHINNQMMRNYHYQVTPIRAIELAMFISMA